MKWHYPVALVVCALALAGFWAWERSSRPLDGPPRATVKGRITLDDALVNAAAIEFKPVSIDGPATLLEVRGGEYSGKVCVGICKISISSNEQIIPNHYNVHSILTREVKAGDDELNFDLTTEMPKSLYPRPDKSSAEPK